jgi:hypothetical protein
VFASERRNHSKTGVYEDLCVRVPVDTPSAVDKLKKAKKSFKFERFDSFLIFRPTRSVGPWSPAKGVHRDGNRVGKGIGRRWGIRSEGSLWVVGRSEASWSQKGREASKMDRQPFASLRPTRSQRSGLKIYTARPCATRCLRTAARGVGQSIPRIAETVEIAKLFESDPTCRLATRSTSERRPGIRSLLLGLERLQAVQSMSRPISLFPNTAQPLQYDPGESWNDRLPTQNAAGRGNEEMTQ